MDNNKRYLEDQELEEDEPLVETAEESEPILYEEEYEEANGDEDEYAPENDAELNEPEESAEELRSEKDEQSRRTIRRINRVLSLILVTVLLFGAAGLGVEYVLVRGPSPQLRNTFVMTMLETRRFGFIPSIFLSDTEIAEIRNRSGQQTEVVTDASLITLPRHEETQEQAEPGQADDYGLVDEDGDGLILVEINKKSFSGYMMVILDPSRVFVGKPQYYGGTGLTIGDMCQRYEARGGINAGGFYDAGGTGMGGNPVGLTVSEGVYYNETAGRDGFVGFDEDGVLHVGYMNAQDAHDRNIRDGVTFNPALIVNGVPAEPSVLVSGINPRTAIGQRADGAVLMLVIDGRQAHSIGCNYGDITEIMLDFGAVNACNLDGGSSTLLWYDGDYVNSPAGVPRPVPTGFLFK